MTGGNQGFLGMEGEAPPCSSAPYCTPPLWNYEEYYNFYGCMMGMNYKNVIKIKAEIKPLVTTFWDQYDPFKHNGKPAGCGPLALMQLMAYHMSPKSYDNESRGKRLDINLEYLRTIVSNEDLIKQPGIANDAKLFCDEIGDRLDVMYFNNGSAVPGVAFGGEILRKTLRSFDYYAYEGNTWNYQNDYNFATVIGSLAAKQPVLIYGFPEGRNGVIKLGQGHVWLLDGYKKEESRYYYADYYFDEYGKFNKENRYMNYMLNEYVHGNMGWGKQDANDYWVHKNVYKFGGTDYCNKIYFIAYIKPK